jgi:Transglycosylase SLT domain
MTNLPPQQASRAVSRAKAALAHMRAIHLTFAIGFLLLNAPMQASAQTEVEAAGDARHQICQLIEAAAQANALPIDFFVRLIWQESRLQPDEIGPVTRSGARALGIAQFMPGTAAERQLFEPFNPVEALPKSGEFLAELRAEFGNLGLAAAAYNAGPQRVRDFLAGARDLPEETRKYVRAITGRPVEEWATSGHDWSLSTQSSEPSPSPSPISCHDLVASLERVPKAFMAQWLGRKFPSWCRALHHPSIEECGPVHLIDPAIKTTNVLLRRSHVHLARSSSH